MSPLTKMKLMIVPMIIVVFAGLKMFLDNHLVLLPTLCILVFILCLILLIKEHGAPARELTPQTSKRY